MMRIRRNSAAHFLNVLTNDAAFASSKRQLQGGGRSGVREFPSGSISAAPQGKISRFNLVPLQFLLELFCIVELLIFG